MKIAWNSIVLLPVLLLPIVLTQAQTCSNGLAGYEQSEVCCPLECGECGGVDCSQLPAGKDCCTSDVKATNVMCSDSGAAPCIIDEAVGTCSNGLAGYESADVCCPVSCGQCGGVGCSALPGGKDCCTSDVKATEVVCSKSGTAPCIIDDAVPEEAAMMCNNGLPGYEAANVCCALECGQCGGVGCSQLPGGKECCTSDVLATGMLCSESGTAPCIIDDAGDDGFEKCSNGLDGYEQAGVCCPLECGECGGVGCSWRPGGQQCCTSNVVATGVLCSDSEAAPCIIDNAGSDDGDDDWVDTAGLLRV